GPLETRRSDGRGPLETMETESRGPLKTMNTEPPFGIRGRAAAQDPEDQWSR
ncbi:unnamed protein product, partial [Musa textilis]